MTILDWFHTPWPYLYMGGFVLIVVMFILLGGK